MDRADIPGGPAFVTFDGITIQAADETWSSEDEVKETEIRTNLQGIVAIREDDLMTRLKLTPLGIWGNLTKLFPWSPSQLGQLMFPSVDKPAVVQTADGVSITYAAAAVVKMPPITFSAGKPLFGEMEILCLRKNDTAPTDAGAHNVVAASAYVEPTLNPDLIVLDQFAVEWGSVAPWDDLEIDEDGITFTPALTFDEVKPNRWGMVNARLKDVTAEVSFRPINITVAEYYAKLAQMDGSGMGRGTAVPSDAFVCTGSPAGVRLTIPKLCRANKGGLSYGGPYRTNQVTMRAVRAAIAGVLQPMFTLDTAV